MSIRALMVLTAAALLILNVAADTAQTETAPTQAAPAKDDAAKTHRVESGDMVLRVEREGRIDSATRIKVRQVPEAYSGSFEVVEVLRRSGKVSKGDVLVRFDPEALNKDIDAARMGVEHARRGLDLLREEFRIQREANAIKLEQSEKSQTRATRDLSIWEKFDGPDMLKGSEMSVQRSEFGLADQRQELDQLEQMYKGSQLANETKEIVLDRARRDIKMTEQWLVLTKNDDQILHQFRHPDKDRDVKDQARWSTMELGHVKFGTEASEVRKSMEIEAAERKVRDAEERYSKLQLDTKLFEANAPADGVMTRIDLEPQDTVNARATICEVLDPKSLHVKFPITAEDVRVLWPDGERSGQPDMALSLPELPDASLKGTMKELAEIGEKGENSTQFPMTVALDSSQNGARIGMRCKVYATRTLSNVLSVPKGAIKWEDGRSWCNVKTALGSERREIRAGQSNDKMTVVVSGLSAGDEVILQDEKAK